MSGTNDATTLNPQDRLRLFRLLGQMPYGAGIKIAQSPEKLTIENLAESLESLAAVLSEHADECYARGVELREHKDLLSAGRRIFAALAAPQE